MAQPQTVDRILRQAPELLQHPAIVYGLAQGNDLMQAAAPSYQDPAPIAQYAALGLMSQGVAQAQAFLAQHFPQVPQPTAVQSAYQQQPQTSPAPAPAPASQTHQDKGWSFGRVFHDITHNPVTHVAGDALNVLNAPLRDVQHVYRYVRDVWERHGVVAGLGELGAITLGGVAGGLVGGSYGAVLGAEGTGTLAGLTSFHNSWQATSNGSLYKDNTGNYISPGMDLSRLVGYLTGAHVRTVKSPNGQIHTTGPWWSNPLSGAGDFTFDLTLDPTIKLGQLSKLARTRGVSMPFSEGERGIQVGSRRFLVGSVPRLSAEVADKVPGKSLVDADSVRASDVQFLYHNNPGVADAFQHIAGMDAYGLYRAYPQLAPLIPALAKAKTADEVANAFEQGLTVRNYSFLAHGLPTTTLTRRLLGNVGIEVPTWAEMSQKLMNGMVAKPDDPFWKRTLALSRFATNPDGSLMVFHHDGMPDSIPIQTPNGFGHVINAFTAYQPFTLNSKTLDISGFKGDPADPQFVRAFYSVLRYSMNAATAKAITARFIMAETTAEKLNILDHAFSDTFRAAGIPDEAPGLEHLTNHSRFMLRELGRGKYALDKHGQTVMTFDQEGQLVNRGLYENQTGQVVFPQYNEIRRLVAESHGALPAFLFKADDFINRHFTTKFFKRLVLLSLGFALRVSSAELIPATFANDARQLAGGAIGSLSAKLNPDVSQLFEQLPHNPGDMPLVGARVAAKQYRHLGVIDDVNLDTGEANVRFHGAEEAPRTMPLNQLTIFHKDIEDPEIRQMAQDYGLSITREELPHIRAAVGHALWGVSKALVDQDYRDVALMNILSNDGHIVAPAIASSHNHALTFRGILPETRAAAIKAGVRKQTLSGVKLGEDFRTWDVDDETFPMFWHFAVKELADNSPGMRRAAAAFRDHMLIPEGVNTEALANDIKKNEGVTYDVAEKQPVGEGYAVALHPKHEEKVALDKFRPSDLESYIHRKGGYFAQGHKLGAWVDNGHVHLDVTQVVPTKEEAVRLGLQRGEKAVGDLAAYGRGEDGTIPLSYDSERRRLLTRRQYVKDNALPAGTTRLMEPHHGPTARSGAAEGAGAEGDAESLATRLYRRPDPVLEQAATEAAVKADRAYIDSEDPAAEKLRRDMVNYHIDPDQFSRARVEGLKGLFFGNDGGVNMDIVDALSHGQTPTMLDLHARPRGQKPFSVKGRTLDPLDDLAAEIDLGGQSLDLSFDGLVQKLWTPIHGVINTLSRAPIWTTLVTNEYKFFKPWMEAGLMTKAEAHNIAQVRALDRALPLIHNPLLRNKMSLMFRNIMPFYFAQEQAYKRYGRAMFSNPKGFREAQLLLHGLHSSGALQSDGQGNQYIVMPGAGWLPTMATIAGHAFGFNILGGVPATMSGDMISLRSVVPELNGQPSVSPLAAIPLKEMAKLFPSTDPLVHTILGPVGYGATTTQELIPNATLRRLWETFAPEDSNRAFGTTFTQVAAYAAHKALILDQKAEQIDKRSMDMTVPLSELDPRARALRMEADAYMPLPNADPSVKKAAMDKLRSTVRSTLFMKAIFGMVSPLSPVMQVGDVKLHNELQNYMKQYGVSGGLQKFMDAHPDATPDTVFGSDNSETGTSPPTTKTAIDWVQANRSWVEHHTLAAAYLIPQKPGAFDQVAYQQELSMGLRQIKTPQEFVDSIYTAEGNAEFIPALKDYETQKAAAQGDSQALQQLNQQWQGYIQDLANRNPVWYENEFSPAKVSTALQAYGQLVDAVHNPQTPDSPQLQYARDLIGSWHDYQAQVNAANSGSGYYNKTALKQQWFDFIDKYVADHPEASAMAYGVFRRLAEI